VTAESTSTAVESTSPAMRKAGTSNHHAVDHVTQKNAGQRSGKFGCGQPALWGTSGSPCGPVRVEGPDTAS
jgi:hypothetical protein